MSNILYISNLFIPNFIIFIADTILNAIVILKNMSFKLDNLTSFTTQYN